MSKQLYFSIDARNKMKKGVDVLANAVKVTLGPKGRNVVIEKKFGAPSVTKDGVTVAKEIELEDPIENMGAQMVKEVASKTADVAGDGTTTATVLAQAIITEGLKNVAAGANPMDLKRGIDKAVAIVVENLSSQSKTVGNETKKIEQVASISANNDSEIGKLIANALNRSGFTSQELLRNGDGTFQIAIGPRARFTSGAPVTATDVVASLDRVIVPTTGSPVAELLAEVRRLGVASPEGDAAAIVRADRDRH